MYTAIQVAGEPFEGYAIKDGVMDRLSRINVFIGRNNSGKSRFLREIFIADKLSYKSSRFNSEDIQPYIDQLKQSVSHTLRSQYGHRFESLLVNVNTIEIPSFFTRQFDLFRALAPASKLQEGIKQSGDGHDHYREAVRQWVGAHIQTLYSKMDGKENLFKEYSDFYIPTLRGLRALQIDRKEGTDSSGFDGSIDNYSERSVKDYRFREEKKQNIYTGLHLYNAARDLLLGPLEDREKIRRFEEFLSDSFFEGNPISIVPRINDDVVHFRIGKEERPIYALGDGIQALIILTYPLFFHQGEKAIICFEEPETNLHPGLQRIFIETLLRPEFASFQYFFTTHSNHFLDLTADYDSISVYTFTKHGADREGTIEIENVNHCERRVLELIGARTSSVFLTNCTIWVEGITDRLYIRKWLELYQAEHGTAYKEDYHYSFVEYAGSNITHWSFLDAADPSAPNINVDKLCAKLFLVTDNDGAGLNTNGTPNRGNKRKKYERQQALKKRLGDEQYYLLEGREIENALSKAVIKKLVTAHEDKLLDFEKFDRKPHEKEPLGKFIAHTVPGLRKKYEAEGGTVHDKLAFCKRAIDATKSFDDLSDEAKELCSRLVAFIKANNE